MSSKLVPRPIYPLLEYLLTIDPDWKEALCFRSHVIPLGLNNKNPLILMLLHNNKNKRKISEKNGAFRKERIRLTHYYRCPSELDVVMTKGYYVP